MKQSITLPTRIRRPLNIGDRCFLSAPTILWAAQNKEIIAAGPAGEISLPTLYRDITSPTITTKGVGVKGKISSGKILTPAHKMIGGGASCHTSNACSDALILTPNHRLVTPHLNIGLLSD